MSSPIPVTASARPMPAWGRSALLVGLFFVGCWGAAIFYWRMTDRMPTAGELAFCLVGAPLLISGGFWLSRRVLDHPPSSTAGPMPATADPAHAGALAILAGALRLPCGSSAEEVCAAIKANKARPGLDRELLDDDGFPVMTARCVCADDEGLREGIGAWMAANGFADAGFIDAQWRALALATQVAEDLASGSYATAQSLHVLPVAPEDWTPAQRRAAGAWLAHTVSQFAWPADRIALAPDVPADARPATILNQLAGAGDAAALTMLVAFASNIGDHTVAQWSRDRTLFTSAHQDGMIPGEGAAGLLVTCSMDLPGQASTTVLSFLEEGRREVSSGESRRGDPKFLAGLAARALDRSRVDSAHIAAIVGDTGHRANRVMELMALASAISPQLDDTEDVIRTGTATTSCVNVPSFSAIILAHHIAIVHGKPVIWVSNEDATWRAAAMVHPPIAPTAGT